MTVNQIKNFIENNLTLSAKDVLNFITQPEIKVTKDKTTYKVDGKYHRTDGPACEYADGTKEWYVDGKLHRTDGPAIEYTDGTKYWYVDEKLHRTDGPAIEYANGDKLWYVDGKELTESEFKARNF